MQLWSCGMSNQEKLSYSDYMTVAKRLALRHKKIKDILLTADENDLISSDDAKILFKDYYIAIGELTMISETRMTYTFNVNHFRIIPLEVNPNDIFQKFDKKIEGLVLTPMLRDEDDEKNPLYWYDQYQIHKSYNKVAGDLGRLDDKKHITGKIKAIQKAIDDLRYRELAIA